MDWSNPREVVKAALALYYRQTEEEQQVGTTRENNGVGFNATDAPFVTDVVRKTLLADRPMTTGQYRAVSNILRKYERQLSGIDLSRIVLLPTVDTNPVVDRQPVAKDTSDGRLIVVNDRLQFHPIVYPSTQIKSLGFSGKKDGGKFWWEASFSLDKVNAVVKLFPKTLVDESVRKAMQSTVNDSVLPENLQNDPVIKDYQKEAISNLRNSKRYMLALAPGLGKTLCAAVAGASLPVVKKVLVVCPKTLMVTWKREIFKWTGEDSEIWHGKFGEGKTRWIIANYETVARKMVIKVKEPGKNKPTFKANLPLEFDLMIVDESVMVKNRHAQRTAALKVIGKAVSRVWELSGAPITRFYDDMWSQLNILDSRRFSSYWRFASSYCVVQNNGWGSEIVNNKEDAKQRLDRDLADIYFARTQDQVLDLPEFIFDTYDIPMTDKQYKLYRQMEETFLADLPEGDWLVAPNVLSQLTRLLQMASNPMLADPSLPDEGAKWDAVEELLQYETLPAIIWTSYIETAKRMSVRLTDAKYRVAVLTGETSTEKRQKVVDDFQAGNLDIIIAHPGVGKFGLTLTAARTAIYLERNFNGDDYYQSLHRVRRIGTTVSPHVIHLVAAKPGNGARTVDHVVDMVLKFRRESVIALTTGMLRKAWDPSTSTLGELHEQIEDAKNTAMAMFFGK